MTPVTGNHYIYKFQRIGQHGFTHPGSILQNNHLGKSTLIMSILQTGNLMNKVSFYSSTRASRCKPLSGLPNSSIQVPLLNPSCQSVPLTPKGVKIILPWVEGSHPVGNGAKHPETRISASSCFKLHTRIRQWQQVKFPWRPAGRCSRSLCCPGPWHTMWHRMQAGRFVGDR